jgi:peptidoglycan hydrolase-like protein with peptidoglycan-binding domain
VTLTIGGRQSVSVYGAGTYFVSANSNPSAVTANMNGVNVDLTGLTVGGANITICQITGGCGNLYAYVAAGSGATAASSVQSLGTPALASFSVSSNGVSGFMGAGSVLTFIMNANQSINTPSVKIAGEQLPVSGGGSGPYTAAYKVTGNEGQPMSVVMAFTNTVGTGGQAYVSLGALSSNVSTAQTSGNSSAGSTAVFTQYLTTGSSGSEVSALQRRLAEDGLFSGSITGYFGSATKAAVKSYQAKHSLTQLGVVGPSTRALLNRGI